jgi:hypothetical protein
MIARGIAVPYARERFDGHLRAFNEALAAGPSAPSDGLRELAHGADPRALTLLA